MYLNTLCLRETKHRHPASMYLFKVNIRNTRKRCDICSKLTIKPPERRYYLWTGKCLMGNSFIIYKALMKSFWNYVLFSLKNQLFSHEKYWINKFVAAWELKRYISKTICRLTSSQIVNSLAHHYISRYSDV